jgi:protein KTI12
MAMVTMCGYPCSGKSTRAQQLAAFFDRKLADPSTPTHLQRALRRVVVVNDEGLSISKHAYDGQFSLLPLRRGKPPLMCRRAQSRRPSRETRPCCVV